MSRRALQRFWRLKGVQLPAVTCSSRMPTILPPGQKPFAPIQDPVQHRLVISLPTNCSIGLALMQPKVQPQYAPVPLPDAFNSIFSNTWLNFEPESNLPEEVDRVVPPSKLPIKEILEPGTDDEKAILCKMHQGRNVKRLRRISMRRHRYVKWLKRMRFKLRKIRFEREKKKAKVFQDQLDSIQLSSVTFEPEGFIKSQIDLARKGGYRYDVQSDLRKLLIPNSDDKK